MENIPEFLPAALEAAGDSSAHAHESVHWSAHDSAHGSVHVHCSPLEFEESASSASSAGAAIGSSSSAVDGESTDKWCTSHPHDLSLFTECECPHTVMHFPQTREPQQEKNELVKKFPTNSSHALYRFHCLGTVEVKFVFSPTSSLLEYRPRLLSLVTRRIIIFNSQRLEENAVPNFDHLKEKIALRAVSTVICEKCPFCAKKRGFMCEQCVLGPEVSIKHPCLYVRVTFND